MAADTIVASSLVGPRPFATGDAVGFTAVGARTAPVGVDVTVAVPVGEAVLAAIGVAVYVANMVCVLVAMTVALAVGLELIRDVEVCIELERTAGEPVVPGFSGDGLTTPASN